MSIQTNRSQAFAFTWTSFVLIAVSFSCLLVLYLYRRRCEKHMRKTGEKPHRKRDSITDRLLHRGGHRERRSYDSYIKNGSTYDEDLRREKEMERGGVQGYPSYPPTAGREAGYEVPVSFTSEDRSRRFAGNTGGTYTTPGARTGPAPTATPMHLNKSRHSPGVIASDLPIRHA